MAAPPPSHLRRLMRRRHSQAAEGSQGTNSREQSKRSRGGDMWEVREYRFDIPPWSPFVSLFLLILASAVGIYQAVLSANWSLAMFGCVVVVGSAFWLIILCRQERHQPE